MPNLVVYVPARVARALDLGGVSLDVQRRACNEVLVGLAGLDGAAATAGSESAAAVPSSLGEPQPDPRLSRRSAVSARSRARPSPGSACPAYVPVGVRCKLCGEVHQKKGAVT